MIGAPARASIASKRILIDAARGVLDAVMIVSEPFAVAYGIGTLDQALIIDIGAGRVDLCRLHGTLPEEQDQITLDEAGDYVDGSCSYRCRFCNGIYQHKNLEQDFSQEAGYLENQGKNQTERKIDCI